MDQTYLLCDDCLTAKCDDGREAGDLAKKGETNTVHEAT